MKILILYHFEIFYVDIYFFNIYIGNHLCVISIIFLMISRRFSSRNQNENEEVVPSLPPKEAWINRKQRCKKLFESIYEANQISSTLLDCIIFIAGKTRVGKSTFLNWLINHKSLIGVKDTANSKYKNNNDEDDDDSNIIYAINNQRQNPQVAKIDNTIKSVTIMPNIKKIDKDTQIIDLPGFQDRGDEIEVTQVEYNITRFFLSAKKAKFLIIFTAPSFNDISNDQFRRTLQNFLSLFHLSKFTTQDKQTLFCSISFCITSVDFKKKTYEIVKKRYINQLATILEKLSVFNSTNTEEIPNFQIISQLTNNVIANKRIELFQLALLKKSPTKNTTLQNLNQLNWRFFNLNDDEQKIASRFQEQFKNLSHQRQQNLTSIVRQRFSFGLKIRFVLGEMLNQMVNNGFKDIQMHNYQNHLRLILQEMPKYQYKQVDLKQSEQLSTYKKLRIFQQLENLSKSIKNYKDWEFQNKFAPPLQYYTKHLVLVLNQQISLMNRLFGQTVTANTYFKKIAININNMLQQSTIFSKLSPDLTIQFVNNSPSFESDFKLKFKEQLSFAQQLRPLKEIKKIYIDYFIKKNILKDEYRPQQIKIIIKTIAILKPQFIQSIDPNTFYLLSCKLRKVLVDIYKSKKLLKQAIQELLYILIQAIKVHLSLTAKKLVQHEQKLEQIIKLQSQALNGLKQLSKCFQQINPQSKLAQTTNLYQRLIKTKNSIQAQNYIYQILQMLVAFGKCFQISFKTDFQMSKSINFSCKPHYQPYLKAIIQQHQNFYENDFLEEPFKVKLPLCHSILDEMAVANQISKIVQGKKVIFVLGQAKSGKSLTINLLKRMKVDISKNKLDLFGNRKSRINHSQKGDPFMYLTPLKENLFFIQIPTIFDDIDPNHRFIRICMLLELMKDVNSFKILLVQRQIQSITNHLSNIFLLSHNFMGIQSKDHDITVIINAASQYQKMVKHFIKKYQQSSKDKQIIEVLANLKIYCQDIQNYSKIIDDYFQYMTFTFKKPKDHYQTIYHQIYSENERQKFVSKLTSKVEFLRKISIPLTKNVFDSQVQIQKTTKQKICQQLQTELNQLDKKWTEYCLTQLKIAQFHPIINNLTLIYANIMQVKRKGFNLDPTYKFEQTYRTMIDYMQTYFNKLSCVYCDNQKQYSIFMKVKHIFISTLKQLQFYCKLFRKKSSKIIDSQQFQFHENFRLNILIERIDNFTDQKQQTLLKKIIMKNVINQPNSQQLNIYIDLLTKYSTKKSQSIICAKIQLITLMAIYGQRCNWSNEINKQKLLDQVIKYLGKKHYSIIRTNIFKEIIQSSKIMQDMVVNQLKSIRKQILTFC